MTEPTCSEECRARRPLGSESHLSSCPLFGSELGELTSLPPRAEGQVIAMRHPETGAPVMVPDDIATEAERDYRAYKKWQAGKDWETIAREDMYPSAEAAAASVQRYLAEGRAVIRDFSRREIIADHVARLMTYRSAMWQAGVTERKPQAMAQLLSIEDRWVKAFGLDQPDAEDQGIQTVVVPSESYIEYLRQLGSGESEADAG